MTEVVVENIIAYAQIAGKLDIQQISKKIPELNYKPAEFSGLTFKLDQPKTAILILSNGKVVCTGGKTVEDVEASIKKIAEKMKNADIKINPKTKIETHNVIASTNLNKELHLSSIASGLLLEHVNYDPEQFPGLVYKMDDLGVVLLIFSSGKIVCSGARSLEDASKAIEMMKEKLSSLGVL